VTTTAARADTTSPRAGCPNCDNTLVTVRDAAAWCPSCEWNLDRYEPERRHPETGWAWLDRRAHRTAYQLTARQYTDLVGRPVGRPGRSPAYMVLVLVAVLLLAVLAALLGSGAYLILHNFPSFGIIPGTLLVLLAVAMRPRLGRLDPLAATLTREQAPTLFRLIDDVAAATGAPVPHTVVTDADFNASAGMVGLRRRRVLTLGLPMWAILPAQQRVALLGHELGHFVNGDARSGPLTNVPFTTLGPLQDLLRPVWGASSGGLLAEIGEVAARGVMAALRSLVLWLYLALLWIASRDWQRAEYLADDLAARAGGSEAAAGLADTLVLADIMLMVIRREARQQQGAPAWRAAADRVRTDVTDRLAALRQLSVRDEVSLQASHPPAGLRVRMIASRPAQQPAVLLSDDDSARIDAELASLYESARRDIVNG